MSLKEIAGAVSAALVVTWGLYVELRMQKLQRADEQLKRQLGDEQITDSTNTLTNNQLASELSKELGGSTVKPKA